MSVHVVSPGLLTSIQDAGRDGLRHLGVGRSGALDAFSFAIANLLVGNREAQAAVEITLSGPTLQFERAARIAICGADIDTRVGEQPIPGWRRVDLPAGSRLEFGHCRRGARAYLAVAGGFAVPRVLGSTSTDLRAGFGGLHGRALLCGDSLALAADFDVDDSGLRIDGRWIDPSPDLDLADACTVRVLPGRDRTCAAAGLDVDDWRVEAASNRQGLRLHGPPLEAEESRERISEPVVPGTVQLPPDGQPIVLLADAQTHGGYPRIGHVISADMPRLAQLRPGNRLRFQWCTASVARQLWLDQRHRLARMAVALESGVERMRVR